MQLKKNSNKGFDLPLQFLRVNKGKIIVIFLVIFLIVGILYAFGELRSAAEIPNRIVYKATGVDVGMEIVVPVYRFIIPPMTYYKNDINARKANPERITIDIKFDDFQKIAYKREIALAESILISSDDDWVPAKIQYKDQTVEVKLRLKGDCLDHIRGNKWSFRIEVKGNETLFGMKIFSIQAPTTREYVREWLLHKTLERESIIALRDYFIDVTINGKHMGIYEVEEHFDKRLIEHNNYREGPIIRYNQYLSWASHMRTAGSSGLDWYSQDIDAFQTGKIMEDPEKFQQFIKANDLLESFRNGNLNTPEVFDIEKLAKFMAISDMMGATHGTATDNLRFYYNPITFRLEPIGYDGGTGRKISGLSGTGDCYGCGVFQIIVFKDMIFFEKYVQELDRVSEKSYLDDLFSDLNEELQKNIDIIHRDYPRYNFQKDNFYYNQNYIKDRLNPIKGLYAFFYSYNMNETIILEVGNIQLMPIEVLGVSYKESQIFEPKEKRNILQGKIPSEPIKYEKIEFVLTKGFNWSDECISDLRLNYKLLGTSHLRNETISHWSHLSEDFLATDFIRQKPNVEMFDFLSVDNATNKILVKYGDWELNDSIIIPAGYTVVCGEGIRLDLKNNATILSYSPLHFFGSEDNPIIISSSDSTGQGISVLNAGKKSILKSVIFKNLSAPSQHGWQLTGAVTFYESPVEIGGCQFLDNKVGDDILNIIRSEFEIKNTLFKNARYDALDVDFGKGLISHTSFVNSGNDGMDFSGSVIDVVNCFVNGVGDKGVSVGENSQVSVNEIELKNCYISVASKDMSQVNIENAEISSCEFGFAIYQKKSEFGPSTMTASSINMVNVDTLYLIEEGSTLLVDNQKIDANEKNVYGILYDKE